MMRVASSASFNKLLLHFDGVPLQDEEERALALAVLGSAGEKKSRVDRRKERKERREVVRQDGRSALMGDEEARLEVSGDWARGKHTNQAGKAATPSETTHHLK